MVTFASSFSLGQETDKTSGDQHPPLATAPVLPRPCGGQERPLAAVWNVCWEGAGEGPGCQTAKQMPGSCPEW